MTALAVPAAVAVGLGLEVARFGGAFRGVDPAFSGTCTALPLAGSAEDIRVDAARGIAYLSFLDRASLAADPGTVMLLDLNVERPAPRPAFVYEPEQFRPHGLSLLKRAGEPTRLFAISHRADGTHSVEIGEEGTNGGFFPQEPVRDPAFVRPNALAALGPRQFYLANDGAAGDDFGRTLEVLLRRGAGNVVYYSGEEARVVARGLKFPAGIALSPDTSKVYVAEALGKRLSIFTREPASGALTLAETVPLDTAPDNLHVDERGIVWIAAHPKLLAFFAHVRDPAKRTPTQVLRFDPQGPKPADGAADARLTTVYVNRGEQISAGTVAAPWREGFLVGALMDRKVLWCKP